MLLNLTNHPSSNWSSEQTDLAVEKFAQIIDLPFPSIPPDYSSQELDTLVEKFADRVLTLSPTVVHIMGEMTFTFRLVNLLKANGIPCIASTTSRSTEEKDGIKLSKFVFVQFRDY
jgi:hypothetical protein